MTGLILFFYLSALPPADSIGADKSANAINPVDLPIVYTSVDVVVKQPADGIEPVEAGRLQMDSTGARTVLDAVEKLVPGAFLTRRGVMGYGISTNGTGGITVRGVGGQPNTGVLIVVDGRPDFQGLMGHPLPDFYDFSDAAKVRVTQGPASVLYGSNAMGGAVEIEPSRPAPGYHTSLRTGLGSYWTTQNKLTHGGAYKSWFYQLAGGVSATSGDRPSSRFRDQDASLAVGRNLGSHWKASLQGRFGFFHIEDPGPTYAPLNNSYARVGRGGYGVHLDNNYAGMAGSIRPFGNFGRHYITDGFRSTDSTNGVRGVETFFLSPRLQVDAGGDFQRYGGQARNATSLLNYGEHHLHEGAGFARLKYAAGARWILQGGYRQHGHSLYGSMQVPEASATFRIAEGYALTAGLARGFRNPTIRELFLFPAPNPKLQPESMLNYQATLSAHPSRSLALTATGFYADLKDQIATTGRYPNLQLLNSGAALNRGFESTARWSPSRRVQLHGGYAYLRSTNLLPFVPAQKFNSALDYSLRRATFSLSSMTVGKRFANTAKTARLGGYTTISARVSMPVREGWTVFCGVDNLLDKRYEVLAGYPMPGVNATAGLMIHF
ncbi:MAG TPA: TonB-dependent receptor [Bryobacteraceae bacterium]|nr:TonB-dependent receptor [Bryobacteraceae bacterium]HPT26525.1 TonB-dependent receptor [Bryobacteraceae bacterium]